MKIQRFAALAKVYASLTVAGMLSPIVFYGLNLKNNSVASAALTILGVGALAYCSRSNLKHSYAFGGSPAVVQRRRKIYNEASILKKVAPKVDWVIFSRPEMVDKLYSELDPSIDERLLRRVHLEKELAEALKSDVALQRKVSDDVIFAQLIGRSFGDQFRDAFRDYWFRYILNHDMFESIRSVFRMVRVFKRSYVPKEISDGFWREIMVLFKTEDKRFTLDGLHYIEDWLGRVVEKIKSGAYLEQLLRHRPIATV